MSEDSVPFPKSLPDFQRLFPDDRACATYLERMRWRDGFLCPKCGERGEPYRFTKRPQVLRCRVCKHDVSLTAGTVMERTHSPLSTWFWAAYIVASNPQISARQLGRQTGCTRYETALRMRSALSVASTWQATLGLTSRKRGPKPIELANRFARHINVSGPVPEHRPELGACHEWTGARDSRGYGKVTVDGRTELAPRVAWMIANGRWPEPCALHHCDNPSCVRPSHLFEGTKADNTADMVAKARGVVVPRKLSPDVVADVLERRRRGERQADVAARYGVSAATISRIEARQH